MSLFRVKDEQSLQSCMLEWQSSLAEPLKARNILTGEGGNPVYVEDLQVGADGTVIVFLTDKSRFEYHTGSRLWREIDPEIELKDMATAAKQFPVTTSTGQKNRGERLVARRGGRPVA